MLSRDQLTIINRKTLKYPLQTAEKDYLLTLVLQIIALSKLNKTLIFKGGTAIHHCYLTQYRFSEDLDFSTNGQRISMVQLASIFSKTKFLTIKKQYQSQATLKIERLQYSGPLAQPNSLKIETDFVQTVILPPKLIAYQNVWGVIFKVLTMDEREICAEKIRAMSDRARYRDFYDLSLLIKKFKPNLADIVTLIKQKEIRQSIKKTKIQTNWQIIKTQQKQDMTQIYYSTLINNQAIQNMIKKLPFEEILAK